VHDVTSGPARPFEPVSPAQQFEDAATSLRHDIIGVRRLLLCSSDGLVICDTDAETTSGSSAATAAAVLGLGHHAASMLGHGAFREAVLRSSDGCLVVYGVGSNRVLAVFCETQVNVPLLDRKCRALITELVGGTAAPAVPPSDPARPLARRTFGRLAGSEQAGSGHPPPGRVRIDP
jgi:uncharacterized protein